MWQSYCLFTTTQVGRAFDTGGVFSERGETPAARASFWRGVLFAERLSAGEEYDSTGGYATRAVRIALVAVRKALEKHFRESDGSTGYRDGRCGRIFTTLGGNAGRAEDCGVVNEPISVEKIA